MSQVNVPKQTLYTIIIVLGIALLLYDFISKPEVIYFKVFGIITLMFGLYKSTQQWTTDNKNDVEESLDEEESKNDNDKSNAS